MSPKRLLYVLPTTLLIAWAAFPWMRGTETLFLRDVFLTHLPLKHAVTEALRAGELPWVDLDRAQGQPLLGNLNAAPLYPDQLLGLLGSTLGSLNAHFWLHWLLAAPAFWLLGRAWGLSRRASWAGGVLWATSGFYLSQLNFYNLIAGVTLTPAFVAAALQASRSEARRAWLAALGVLWTLLLLAGDPMTAGTALLLAALALLCERRPAEAPKRALAAPALALVAGTALALPQLVELLRTVQGSFRGVYGLSERAATAASWQLGQALELLLPFPFGRPDTLGTDAFWGHAFHGGNPPFYFAVYPGLLGLALLLVAGKPSAGRARFGWIAIAVGLVISLGRANPLVTWLFPLLGLRYPAKLWLAVALGATVLAAIGFERALVQAEPAARRRLLLGLGLGAGIAGLGALIGTLAPTFGQDLLALLLPASLAPRLAEPEAARLAALAGVLTACGVALLAAAWLAGRRPAWAPWLLAVHAATQLFLLQPLYPSDASVLYQVDAPANALIARGELLAHFGAGALRAHPELAAAYPEPRMAWHARRVAAELWPQVGTTLGRRYAFASSTEGLDALGSRLIAEAAEGSEQPERLKLCLASGVDRVVLPTPLEPGLAPLAEPAGELAVLGRTLHVYTLPRTLPPAAVFSRVRTARDATEVYKALVAPDFDVRREVVVEGPVAVAAGEGEALEVTGASESPTRWSAEVEAGPGGLLVLARAYLPAYRATVDGRPAATRTANLHLLAVEVPAGRHRIEIVYDKTPFRWALLGVPVGLALLVLLGRKRAR
jgi:hypothetical protein